MHPLNPPPPAPPPTSHVILTLLDILYSGELPEQMVSVYGFQKRRFSSLAKAESWEQKQIKSIKCFRKFFQNWDSLTKDHS